jgi:hypothetical protein
MEKEIAQVERKKALRILNLRGKMSLICMLEPTPFTLNEPHKCALLPETDLKMLLPLTPNRNPAPKKYEQTTPLQVPK